MFKVELFYLEYALKYYGEKYKRNVYIKNVYQALSKKEHSNKNNYGNIIHMLKIVLHSFITKSKSYNKESIKTLIEIFRELKLDINQEEWITLTIKIYTIV